MTASVSREVPHAAIPPSRSPRPAPQGGRPRPGGRLAGRPPDRAGLRGRPARQLDPRGGAPHGGRPREREVLVRPLRARVPGGRLDRAGARGDREGAGGRASMKRVMPKFTPAPPQMVALFARAIGGLPGVEQRTMSRSPAAFVNGNMFGGLFQDGMMLRLSEEDRRASGAPPFEPTPGRPMREYITVPDPMLRSEALLVSWLRKSHAYAASLPPRSRK